MRPHEQHSWRFHDAATWPTLQAKPRDQKKTRRELPLLLLLLLLLQ
jgi:hypothetical protein